MEMLGELPGASLFTAGPGFGVQGALPPAARGEELVGLLTGNDVRRYLQIRAALARTHLDRARAHLASHGEEYVAAEIDRLEALLQQHKRASAGVKPPRGRYE